MSKTSRQNRQEIPTDRAHRELANFKHRDLQRACILRGLSSDRVVGDGHLELVRWFIANYDNGQDDQLIAAHDRWVVAELKAKGLKDDDALLNPAMRFGYGGNIEQMEKPKSTPPAKIPKVIEKAKSSIDPELGVRTGTKKSLTFQLTKGGKYAIEKIIELVVAKFPDANEKSIKIWQKRCLNEMKANKTESNVKKQKK